MNNNAFLSVLFIGTMIFSAHAYAGKVVLGGTIDAIYLAQHRIVINDQSYPLARHVVVSHNHKRYALHRLRAGQAVRYTLKGVSGKSRHGDVSDIVVINRPSKHRE